MNQREYDRKLNITLAKAYSSYIGCIKNDISVCGPYTPEYLASRGWDIFKNTQSIFRIVIS